MISKTEIDYNDILLPEEYAKIRQKRRSELLAIKRPRRIDIGPVATCYFECYQTIIHQINEMLYIEKGGEAQIADEIEAYAPMIPNGQELTCTLMFEIDDPVRRKNFLSRLGGVEETMFLRFDGEEIIGRPEEDVDRTTADGKASSVQFIHFPFIPPLIEKFQKPDAQIIIGFTHEAYEHMSILGDDSRRSLAKDFS